MIVALILAQMYWKHRLTKWAESQHLQLVSFRGAWFFEGPSAWTRSRPAARLPRSNQRPRRPNSLLLDHVRHLLGLHLRRTHHQSGVERRRRLSRNRHAPRDCSGFRDGDRRSSRIVSKNCSSIAPRISSVVSSRRPTASDTAGKVGNIGAVAGARFFVDDGELHRVEACLYQDNTT